MNLKEAFRYQNKIQSLMETAMEILSVDSNVTMTENTYYRHKVNIDADDETVAEIPESEYADRITEISRFLIFLLSEKKSLYRAIRRAKNTLEIDMDSEITMNSLRQSVASVFQHMNDLRGSEQIIPNGGTGLRFNAEGNQTTYRCDVKRVVTINYDRNFIKNMLSALNRQSDETSAKIDLCLVTTPVDYEPPFDVNSSFSEAFEFFSERA
ncbi:MAG: hypothetical protein J5933_05205 [Clostridia bacterium]|nr:hypothetical protein [Clostridia bacterium]